LVVGCWPLVACCQLLVMSFKISYLSFIKIWNQYLVSEIKQPETFLYFALKYKETGNDG